MILYIDPGTGSMLFYLAISVVSVLHFGLRKLIVKLKYSSHSKIKEEDHSIPLVIFSDGKQYWQFFEPVCKELDSRSFDVTYYTMSEDDPALDSNLRHLHAEFIGSGNNAFSKMNMLKADIVLSTTPGLDVFQWRRSKGVKCYVHLLHGACIAGYEMFGVDFYDVLLLGAKHQEDNIRELEQLRSEKNKELYYIGVPYWDSMQQRIEGTSVGDNDETTVLLAPSWGARSLLLKKYGEQIIDQLLETGYKIIIRPHPQSYVSEVELLERLSIKYGDKIEWNRDPDNFDVLMRADLMISEYSSVVYDFACVFDKPVICLRTERDYSTYDICWLKETSAWTVESLPQAGEMLTPENIGDIKELIERCLTSDLYGQNRKKLCEETWMNKGEGAKKAADYLIDKLKVLRGSGQ